MSDQPQQSDVTIKTAPVTHEDVRAIASGVATEIVDAAVAAHMNAPAASPAAGSEVGQHMIETNNRLDRIEAAIGVGLPVFNEAAGIAGAFIPGAAPIVSRLPQLESVVFSLIGALGEAFPKLELPDVTNPGTTATG